MSVDPSLQLPWHSNVPATASDPTRAILSSATARSVGERLSRKLSSVSSSSTYMVSIIRARTPASSWSVAVPSCIGQSHPYSVIDIALCDVA